MLQILKIIAQGIAKVFRRKPTKPPRKPDKSRPKCKQNCGNEKPNPYRSRTREQNEKSAARERELIDEHKRKLDDYKRDPLQSDNKGSYKNAPNDEVRRKIYEGRIKLLERDIRKHEEELRKLMEVLGGS